MAQPVPQDLRVWMVAVLSEGLSVRTAVARTGVLVASGCDRASGPGQDRG